MRNAQTRQRRQCSSFISFDLIQRAVAISLLFISSAGFAQTTPAGQVPAVPDFSKYPGLLPEFGRLFQKLQHDVQVPPARSQSRLLPLLPESTIFYAAFPNYGETSHQALAIFQKEVNESAVLREWWQQGEMAANGPKIEDGLEKFYQFSQFLGDEIVVSVATERRPEPTRLLILAEVKKPGLKDFLEQARKELAGTSEPAVRLVDVKELATAKDTPPSQSLTILVRPDFVVAALDVATLRSFNARLEKDGREFAVTPFGRRVAQAYEGGTTVVAAADLERIIRQLPIGANQQNEKLFQRTGFAEAKYLVWEHKDVAGQAASQMELSFTKPRHGVASWLADPGPLGSLDFVSPKAMVAGAVLLKNPAEIFDDVKDLAAASNPNGLAGLMQMEQGLKLSLRDDLFGGLGGEIGYEVDNVKPPNPVWKVILKVNDPDRLQLTLTTLLATANMRVQKSEDGGFTFYRLQNPSAPKTTEMGFAFVDGYLIVASSRDTIAEAARIHRGGESLAKSDKFLAALPPGHTAEASALSYQMPNAMALLSMRQATSAIAADWLAQSMTNTTPAVVCAYAEETVLREASRSGGVDAGVALIGAAIAIPNLMRARMAANESSAAATIRTANTAQVIYQSSYPERGYAHDLASLGPDPGKPNSMSADHASVIDSTLGNSSCTAGTWCTKSGFRFIIKASCLQQRCAEYVVVGTPVDFNNGTRSFCSTSDTVVRYKAGPALTAPVSVAECRTWVPLH